MTPEHGMLLSPTIGCDRVNILSQAPSPESASEGILLMTKLLKKRTLIHRRTLLGSEANTVKGCQARYTAAFCDKGVPNYYGIGK